MSPALFFYLFAMIIYIGFALRTRTEPQVKIFKNEFNGRANTVSKTEPLYKHLTITVTACNGLLGHSYPNNIGVQIKGKAGTTQHFNMSQSSVLGESIARDYYVSYEKRKSIMSIGDIYGIGLRIYEKHEYCMKELSVHNNGTKLHFSSAYFGNGIVLSRSCVRSFVYISADLPMIPCIDDAHFRLTSNVTRGVYNISIRSCNVTNSDLDFTDMTNSLYAVLIGKETNSASYSSTKINYLDHYIIDRSHTTHSTIEIDYLGYLVASNVQFTANIRVLTEYDYDYQTGTGHRKPRISPESHDYCFDKHGTELVGMKSKLECMKGSKKRRNICLDTLKNDVYEQRNRQLCMDATKISKKCRIDCFKTSVYGKWCCRDWRKEKTFKLVTDDYCFNEHGNTSKSASGTIPPETIAQRYGQSVCSEKYKCYMRCSQSRILGATVWNCDVYEAYAVPHQYEFNSAVEGYLVGIKIEAVDYDNYPLNTTYFDLFLLTVDGVTYSKVMSRKFDDGRYVVIGLNGFPKISKNEQISINMNYEDAPLNIYFIVGYDEKRLKSCHLAANHVCSTIYGNSLTLSKEEQYLRTLFTRNISNQSICSLPHWSSNTVRTFQFNTELDITDIAALSIGNNGEGSICIDEVTVNEKSAGYISSHWIGAGTNSTILSAVLKYPVCVSEIVDIISEINATSIDIPATMLLLKVCSEIKTLCPPK